MDIDTEAALALVKKLIAIDGVSGEEAEVAAYIEEIARCAGVKKTWITRDSAHKRSPAGGDCGNLIITLPGTLKKSRIMCSAHIDTVEIARGSVPAVRGNYIIPKGDTALGADNRAGVAVLLCALISVMKNGIPHPPLTFLFTVQEEIGLFGARYAAVSKFKNPSCCYNVDGDSPRRIVLRAPSSSVFYAAVKGKAAHAGQHPDAGISAALILAKALTEIERRGIFGHIERKGRKTATSNIGTVSGGTASNVVMDVLELKGEARSYSQPLLDRIVSVYRTSLEKAARSVKNRDGESGSVEFSEEQIYTTFSIPAGSPQVKRLVSVLEKLDMVPEYPEIFGGLDANWLSAFSIPTVTIGAGGRNPHTKGERLYIPDFLNACRVILRLLVT